MYVDMCMEFIDIDWFGEIIDIIGFQCVDDMFCFGEFCYEDYGYRCDCCIGFQLVVGFEFIEFRYDGIYEDDIWCDFFGDVDICLFCCGDQYGEVCLFQCIGQEVQCFGIVVYDQYDIVWFSYWWFLFLFCLEIVYSLLC